jgi:RHS repeat-associated protein
VKTSAAACKAQAASVAFWLLPQKPLQVPSSKNKELETKNQEQPTKNVYHYDSNGNVILLTGIDSQSTARYRYDAFGKTLQATGPAAVMNRYRFSTKPLESGSGLAFYGYRYLSPELGRWVSRDPIEERGGVNLYGMVGNGAISEVDRLGLAAPLALPFVCGCGEASASLLAAGAAIGTCAIVIGRKFDLAKCLVGCIDLASTLALGCILADDIDECLRLTGEAERKCVAKCRQADAIAEVAGLN